MSVPAGIDTDIEEGPRVAENDQEATSSSDSGDASTRESYRSLLAQLHDDGTLGDDGYRHRLADVDAARTVGELETAISGLNRGDLPVPTRRRQRRELDDVAAEPEPLDEVPAEEIELDELEDDDFDDLELPELPGATPEDDDSDEDDDDPEDEDDDSEDEDDDLDDDDLDDDDDEPAPKAVAKKSSSRTATSTTSDRSSGREKKTKATPKRPSSAAQEPESTGPIQFVKESVAELRKVVYPTSSQLGTYFVVVLVFVLFVIGFTSGIDLGLGKLVLMVFG